MGNSLGTGKRNRCPGEQWLLSYLNQPGFYKCTKMLKSGKGDESGIRIGGSGWRMNLITLSKG